jgi:CPA2 family monovalent cation:H+ antiporter-2
MDVSLRIFQELAILLAVAAVTAYVLARFRIPPALGYLVVGILIGPGGIGFIKEIDFIRAMGDLGVILLMFGLGLDFEINRLRKTATMSVIAGVASVLTTFVVVNACALLFGLRPLEALFLAAGLAICGTAVNLKILADMGHLKTHYGSSIAATIVVTDIAAVLLLTALSGIALGGGLDARSLSISLFKAAGFLVLAPAFGFAVVPRVLNIVARGTRSREALLITTLALCFGLALISQRLGFSLALGAFVMGMVVSEARVYHPIEEMVKPLEHIFATLFFFSVGLSIKLGAALPHWPLVLVLVGVIALTKVVSVSTAAYLNGRTGRVALAAGWGLVPIGEFSFVIVNEGVRFGVLGSEYLSVTVAVALGTAVVAVAGLRSLTSTVHRITEVLPVGVLNLLTLVQLRAAGSTAVPGLPDATAHLKGRETAEPGGESGGDPAQRDPLAEQRERQRYNKAAWAEIVDIGLNSVLIITITLVLIGIGHVLNPIAPSWLNVRLAAAAVAIVVCAPSLVFLFKSGADLAGLVSERLAGRFQWVDPRVTRGALVAGSVFVLYLFLQVAVLPIVVVELRESSVPVLVVAAVITIALGYFTWRALVRFQAGLTGLVRSSLSQAARSAGTAATQPTAQPGEHGHGKRHGPYRAMIDHVRVSPHSAVVGKAIGKSGLREASGVSILGIDRRGEWIGNPGAEEIIHPGDELVVIGSEDQRDSAERLLRKWGIDTEDETG